MNIKTVDATPDDAQSPQASASTNSATRACDVTVVGDGVSQESARASSAKVSKEKFPENKISTTSRVRNAGNRIAMVPVQAPQERGYRDRPIVANSNGRRGGQPTHGLSKTPEFRARIRAKDRCHKQSDRDFTNYGARGIAMCDEWRNSFASFYAAVGPRPSVLYSLDRINNDGNYEPGNVRWATKSVQNGNRRRAGT